MKTAVFVFGRFNPPTIGHEKLINATIAAGQRERGDVFIYGSHSNDSKSNPLTHKEKMGYLKKMYPRLIKSIKDTAKERNVLEIAATLTKKYDKLIMVAGSDRVDDFTSLLNSYNGIKSKHGFYEFKEIEVVSAGERDPDAEGASGMSASKMRNSAVKGDFETFLLGASSELTVKDKKKMMNDVRKGLKLDSIREAMKRRRGLEEKPVEKPITYIEATELSWQGYDTENLSTCDEAFELFDEIINSVGEGTFTKAEFAYLKEALILSDKCLTIAQVPEELIEDQDVRDYIECSNKATKLLETIRKRTGIPFNYSFLNDLQVRVVKNVQPKKSFTKFSGEMYGVR
jgi:phosphopantetheine adenylyltransferase